MEKLFEILFPAKVVETFLTVVFLTGVSKTIPVKSLPFLDFTTQMESTPVKIIPTLKVPGVDSTFDNEEVPINIDIFLFRPSGCYVYLI